MKYAAIDSMRQQFPISMLCQLLEVSTSGYHEWRCRKPSARRRANERLVTQIRVLHAESFGSYGSPRIHAALIRRGQSVGRERIRRLMQENQIVGRHRRKRCRTTDSNHALPVAPNLLNQNFDCEALNTVWLADISYLPTGQGFLYFAGMKDLCTKKIVGWSMSATIDASWSSMRWSWRSHASSRRRGLWCIRIVAASTPVPTFARCSSSTACVRACHDGATATTMRRWRASSRA